ncbi:Purine nucleosidase [Propionibacterium freudenreichii]|nr:Purine nucleosidase [Propionibacterium freudenreichii]SCQ76753.1 Purine nucleosidase [Propionibacterium freudenreichii]
MRIIADVDTGIDDALALVAVAAHVDAELVGMTTTTGNTTSHLAARNSAAVLSLVGRDDVPVLVGSSKPLEVPVATTPETHGEFGLGYSTAPEAITGPFSEHGIEELWLPELREHPGQTTLLVTGPLTNLAIALRAEPELPRLARRVVIMGGAFNYPGNTTPSAEWNAWCDPHAAAEVYAAFSGLEADRLPIVAGLNVTETVELTPADLDELAIGAGARPPHLTARSARDVGPADTGVPLVNLVTDALRFYFEFHADHGYGYLAQVHDLLAAQIALGEVDPTMSPQWVGVEKESALTRGTTVADFRQLLHRPANARVVTAVDARASVEAFKASVARLI